MNTITKKRVMTVVACAITVFFTFSPAHAQKDLAQEVQNAEKALAAGNYKKAFKAYSSLAAQKNNPLAQSTLALFYENGWGRPQDRAQACQWFAKAAAGGIPAAQHFWGDCLSQGIGQPVDSAQAAIWYEKAANLGHLISLCSLGDLYVSGRGVSKNPLKGVALCREAAEQGVIPAQIRLGRLLMEGDEAILNAQEALVWFQSAAQSNAPEAQYFLGVMARNGLGMESNPLIARSWFERAAGQGYLPAYFPTARLYFAPIGEHLAEAISEHDLAKAYMWLSATARRLQGGDDLSSTEKMLAEVTAIMPKTWADELDAKVAKHLAEYHKLP